MNPKIKKAILLQLVVWGTALLLIVALALVASPEVSHQLEECLTLFVFLMYLTPFIGWFFLLPSVQGFWKKIGIGLLFLVVVWVLNLFGMGLFDALNFKSLAEKRKEQEVAAKAPYYAAKEKEIDQKLSEIRSVKQAADFLGEMLKRRQEKLRDFNLTNIETECFLKMLGEKRKLFGDEATAKMCLLSLQYGGAADSEELATLYDDILWKDTAAAVQAMVEAKKELLPEFKNNDFYRLLYGQALFVPWDNTDLTESQRMEKVKPFKKKLKALRNPSNAEFIDYLLGDKRLENWTY